MTSYLRRILAFVVAVAATVLLFLLVQFLIDVPWDDLPSKAEKTSPRVVRVPPSGGMNRGRSTPVRKRFELPEPTTVPQPLALSDRMRVAHRADTAPRLAPGGLASVVTRGTGYLDGASPIARVEPEYPRDAAKDGVEGWVLVGFDVTPTGATTNVRVLEAEPTKIFDKEAVAAVSKWKYAPQVIDGEAVTTTGIEIRLVFRLLDLTARTGDG